MSDTSTSKLDSREQIAEIDRENVLGSVEELSKQCEDAWTQASKIEVPESYLDVQNIVMTGMGGSGLGARVIQSVYADEITVPLIRLHDYDLPSWTNERTLVICSSYSGTTEEIVNTARQAIDKRAKWMAIGTGNTLIDQAKEHDVPHYTIDPRHNPSNQPRMAIGYSVVGQLVLASKAGLFGLEHRDIENIVTTMKNVVENNTVEIPLENNPAKKLAKLLYKKNVFYVSARHLVGAMHTVSNQLNENAKVFSADYVIPELNHHLMEGLKHPETNPDNLFIVFAKSDLYPDRIKQRFDVTHDVVEKNKIQNYIINLASELKLTQAFELMQFGGYVNLYLSILYGQNPAPIPWVDYFKNKLGQPLGK